MDSNPSDQHRGSVSRTPWVLWGFVVGLVLGVAMTWWGVYVYQDRTREETIQRLNGQLAKVQQDADALYAERNVLEGQLAIESSTRQGLERTLATVQRELGAARDQVAFFYELLPPGPDGSISVRGLDVQQKGRLLQFRVLLMRHGAGVEPFEGALQFQATGQVAGSPVTVLLEPARGRDLASNAGHNASMKSLNMSGPDTTDTDTTGVDTTGTNTTGTDTTGTDTTEPEASSNMVLALQFDQFQRSAGLLQIPEGMEIDEITLNVFEGETLRVSRTVDIPVQGPVR